MIVPLQVPAASPEVFTATLTDVGILPDEGVAESQFDPQELVAVVMLNRAELELDAAILSG